MASVTVTKSYAVSLNLYLAVFRLSDGKVFDWSDNTWKLIGSATTPGVAMAATVAVLGSTNSLYTAAVNLSTINSTLAPVDVAIQVYRRAGGSPAPTTDSIVSAPVTITILAGEDVPKEKAAQAYVVDVTTNYTTTLGTSMHFTAALKAADGRLVALTTVDPAATCAMVLTMDAATSGGARIPVNTFTTGDCGSVNASSQFEVEYANPGLTANRGFRLAVTITSSGTSYLGDVKFNT